MNFEKTKDFLKVNFFFFVVAIACVVYVIRGFVTIVETGKTIGEIIADGFVSALFGFFISKLLSLQGLAKGEQDPNVIKTNNLHAKTVEKISPKIYQLDEWCEMKNREALKTAQSKKLATAGVAYEDFVKGIYRIITTDGEKFVIERELPKEKLKVVKKARKISLTPLTSSALTSDGGNIVDPYYLGMEKKEYTIKRDGKQLISKIMCGVLFGFYGVKLIADFNVSNLIWTAIQVALFLIMGVISYLQAYFFIVDEYRHRIIKKIDNLEKFDNQTGGNNDIQKLDEIL